MLPHYRLTAIVISYCSCFSKAPSMPTNDSKCPLFFVPAAKRHPTGSEPQRVCGQHGEVQEVCRAKEMEGETSTRDYNISYTTMIINIYSGLEIQIDNMEQRITEMHTAARSVINMVSCIPVEVLLLRCFFHSLPAICASYLLV